MLTLGGWRSRIAKNGAKLLGFVASIGLGSEAVAQQAPVAPSQVTPRNLLPPPPVLPPPLAIPRSLPAEAPPGSDKVRLTVAAITVDDGYPEMAAKTRALIEPLQGHEVSVGDLYRAAAALEASYVRAGYFLARVVVPEQRVANGATFHFALIDGFVESLQDSGLPWQIRGPVHRKMKGIVGKKKPKLAELDARLAAAGAVPGAKVRSTLGQGEQPGGARLILDGGFAPFGFSIGGDNRLGPSFNNWGLNLSAQINSPTGNGEQFYGFLSVNPHFDLGHNALRRVAGGGLILPITGTGISINPEFTISDTNPKVGNPIFASNGRLYRGSFSLLAPLTFVHTGALSAKGSLILTDETQSLPLFGIDLSHDRLTVLQGELTWQVQPFAGNQFSADLIFSKGITGLGARTTASVLVSDTPTSRGSDPQFTTLEARLEVDQALFAGFGIAMIARGQASFGTTVPNAYSFDLSGLDSLSSFTAGNLSSDGGAVLRSELSRPIALSHRKLRLLATPYAYAAIGRAHYVFADPLNPDWARSYGIGLHFSAQGLPLGAGLNASVEYGHSHLANGVAPGDRVSVSFGVQF